MQFLNWLLSKMLQTIFGGGHERRPDVIAAEKEAGVLEGEYADRARNFEGDYNAAVKLLRNRLDKSIRVATMAD